MIPLVSEVGADVSLQGADIPSGKAFRRGHKREGTCHTLGAAMSLDTHPIGTRISCSVGGRPFSDAVAKSRTRSSRRWLLPAAIAGLVAMTALPSTVRAAGSPVISQVFGGGGLPGATYKNDFIEIFNPTGTSISLAGWSVQYSSAVGVPSWSVTPLAGSVGPGRYYLVQEAAGPGGTTNLPSPDATGTIAMAPNHGMVALVHGTTALTDDCGAGGAAVDFIGYGGSASCFEGATYTPNINSGKAAMRVDQGCQDTDENAKDFLIVTPSPRNTAAPAHTCLAPVSFPRGTDFAAGIAPSSVAIADLNGDGKPDMAVTAPGFGDGNTVSILLGAGDGTFSPGTDAVAGMGASGVAIADLNGDAKPDLVVANLTGASVSALPGNGDGTFGTGAEFPTGGNPGMVAVADLDGDGTLDLVTANVADGTVSVLLGNGDGTFGAPTQFTTTGGPITVSIADLNGDAKPDLAVVYNDLAQEVAILLGYGDGTFGPSTLVATIYNPFWLAVSDLNADGKQDLVVADATFWIVSVFMGHGDGTFGPNTDFDTGINPDFLTIGDMNGDGHPDVVAANYQDNTVSVLLGYGDGTLGAKTDFATGETPVAVAIADLNADGRPDLAAANVNGNSVSVLLQGDLSPISDLSAAPVTTGNDGDGTIKVRLDWTPLPGTYTYDVFRAPHGNYPEYDTAPARVPTASSIYPNRPPWVLTSVTHPGEFDEVAGRDFEYYVVYARDGSGRHSAVSNRTNGTLDYFLGDVSAGCVGNNRVNTQDLSFLGAHYGATLAPGDPLGCLDVGPTSDFSVTSRPVPDDRLNFEDLIMFAINYNAVSAVAMRASSTVSAVADADELSVEASHVVQSGDRIDATLRLKGAGDLQGLSAQLAWNSAVVEPVSVAAGEMLAGENGVALSPAPGRVDVALLGARGQGLAGDGALATVGFRAVGPGDPGITIARADARDAANHPVTLALAGAPATPRATELMAATPNPFQDQSLLAYSLARRGPVHLAIYSVDGRRVRVLVNDTRAAGVYRCAWDGRDDHGNAARPGVFFARLATADGHFTRTVLRVQ